MSDKYEKIIIAVDGSKASEKAFNKSVNIAKTNNATLIVVHVVDTRTFATAQAYDKSLTIRAQQQAEDLINEYVNKAKEADVKNVEQIIEYGSPKIAIAEDIAPENDVDLIIVGATGLGAIEHFLIGSVSESVTRYAKCDVLVVR